ncbi:hypothetical protein [Xenorhabdus sp. KJ12.1]|nr:hypothetical protein [Xenorhabdus sp. KJ12.1]PHM69781.1 Txp40, insecticidal toxin [Xenorhabdus sp. KJ12.1]
MVWVVDDERAEWAQIPRAAENKYDEWVRIIVENNRSPSDAARDIGDSNFKMLSGATELYTIRLSQRHRVLFTIDSVNEIVRVLQVGGHT